MPTFPTPSQYQEALQVPEAAFADPALREATLEETPLGLPRVITGAFAAVFPLHTRTRRWAVKCFLTDVPDQRQRYAAISDHLASHPLPYTVDFDYQPRGVEVRGQWWPLLKMAWVEGVPLNTYVARHLGDPERLRHLARAWRSMLADLQEAAVAHGDLQHGNVLVDDDSDTLRLRLVDYDTLYVPALQGRGSPEVGHRNYQHPDRTERTYGPDLDRFSGLAVYVALLACAARPELWERHDTGENVLFTAADFYDPSASPLLSTLRADASLRPWADLLHRACLQDPADVPSLEAAAALTDQDGPLPAVAPRTRRHRDPQHGGRRRTTVERLLPACALGSVAAGAGVGLIASSPWAGAAVGALLLAGVTVVAFLQYRRLPAVRRRARLRQERRYFAERLTRLDQERSRLDAAQRSHVDRAEEVRADWLREAQEETLYDHLKHHFIGEVAAVEGVSHKTMVRLKAAGIRTAYDVTPERLRPLTTIGETSKARILMWRAGLVRAVQDTIPEALSPAQERRVERLITQRAEDLAREIARVEAKIQVQREERDQVEARGAALPDISAGRYLRYLWGLATLPPPMAPPRPVHPAASASTASASPASAERPPRTDADGAEAEATAASEASTPVDDDAPWWTRPDPSST